MPALEEPTYWSHNSAPPVDDDNQPILYDLPQTWQTATNDGERWRWLLEATALADPDRATTTRMQYADFLHARFGVQTHDGRKVLFIPKFALVLKNSLVSLPNVTRKPPKWEKGARGPL